MALKQGFLGLVGAPAAGGELHELVGEPRVRRAAHPLEREGDAVLATDVRDVVEELLDALGAPELLRVEGRGLHPFGREIRLEHVRVPAHLDGALRLIGQRALEAPLADEAPGAGDVGEDVEHHVGEGRAVGHGWLQRRVVALRPPWMHEFA